MWMEPRSRKWTKCNARASWMCRQCWEYQLERGRVGRGNISTRRDAQSSPGGPKAHRGLKRAHAQHWGKVEQTRTPPSNFCCYSLNSPWWPTCMSVPDNLKCLEPWAFPSIDFGLSLPGRRLNPANSTEDFVRVTTCWASVKQVGLI